eukprot:2479969-Amphidinium_carterae.1
MRGRSYAWWKAEKGRERAKEKATPHVTLRGAGTGKPRRASVGARLSGVATKGEEKGKGAKAKRMPGGASKGDEKGKGDKGMPGDSASKGEEKGKGGKGKGMP